MKRSISAIGLTLDPRVRILLSESAKSRHPGYVADENPDRRTVLFSSPATAGSRYFIVDRYAP